jgi:hypothetical protein
LGPGVVEHALDAGELVQALAELRARFQAAFADPARPQRYSEMMASV